MGVAQNLNCQPLVRLTDESMCRFLRLYSAQRCLPENRGLGFESGPCFFLKLASREPAYHGKEKQITSCTTTPSTSKHNNRLKRTVVQHRVCTQQTRVHDTHTQTLAHPLIRHHTSTSQTPITWCEVKTRTSKGWNQSCRTSFVVQVTPPRSTPIDQILHVRTRCH